ncbi:hypothetical protein HIM_08802 [Hirsutella minnesotensis 3608]|uniref:Uncharacterized protein n=1 Tax=Hirsutella minnesotensis 3608 TaxID=1043627 RepID=A0A0F7ZY35_9HYPO|nr:hypothetical protein HIM_08802 [Hirsutella minnesotensis 3608]
MAGAISGGYFPVYPQHGDLPDPEVRTFITNFYRVSDKPDANELWISYFTKDADVTMGADTGHGEQEIRELRGRMWTTVQERRHTVTKVFPGQFEGGAGKEGELGGCELMLFGDVALTTKDGQRATVPWAAHAVLTLERDGERDEWKFARYRVWLQR